MTRRVAAVIVVLGAWLATNSNLQAQAQTQKTTAESVRDAIRLAHAQSAKDDPETGLNLLRLAQIAVRTDSKLSTSEKDLCLEKIQAEMIACVRALEALEDRQQQQETKKIAKEEQKAVVETLQTEENHLAQEMGQILPQLGVGGGGGGIGPIGGGGGFGGGGFGGGGFGGGGGGFGGSFGFGPQIGFVPVGVTLNATPVVSHDRRYVRLALSPNFIDTLSFQNFTVNGAVGGGGGGFGGGLGGGF